jgi:2-amino-4-hydroxy-6-hydroxymethyldihydropteridine diphosphokinase
METVFLGVGSNVGDREACIRRAAGALSDSFSGFAVSRLYETLPRYNEDQPKFLNCVFAGTTHLSPNELLARIHDVESAEGRDRVSAGWMGPRTIDIDILLFGKRRIDTPELKVPHPRMKERKFVLVPLLELDPSLREPGSAEAYFDILDRLEPQGIYYYALNSV